MDAETRRKLDTANRALAFLHANPDSDPGFVAIVTKLEATIARADEQAMQQRDGTVEEKAAISQRQDLRLMMQIRLRHLGRVARSALQDHPEIQGAFTLPRPGVALATFTTAARSMLATAADQQTLLIGLGLGMSFVGELNQAMATLDSTSGGATTNHLAHIGARADLSMTANEGIRLIRLLDGLNKARFRGNPDLLAEWKSASKVVRPARATRAPEPVGPEPVPAPEPVVVALTKKSGDGDER